MAARTLSKWIMISGRVDILTEVPVRVQKADYNSFIQLGDVGRFKPFKQKRSHGGR